jgi:serine/threonine protein kinase
VELESVLGQGGFATVWRGKWMWSVVAVKVFKAGVSEDTMRKFRSEAKTLRALRHPNICYFFDTGLLEGVPVIVLE